MHSSCLPIRLGQVSKAFRLQVVDPTWLHAVPSGPLRGSDPETVLDHSLHGSHHHPHTARLGETRQIRHSTRGGEEQPASHSLMDANYSVLPENKRSL